MKQNHWAPWIPRWVAPTQITGADVAVVAGSQCLLKPNCTKLFLKSERVTQKTAHTSDDLSWSNSKLLSSVQSPVLPGFQNKTWSYKKLVIWERKCCWQEACKHGQASSLVDSLGKEKLLVFSNEPLMLCYQGVYSNFVCKMLWVGKLWEFCSQKWRLWSIISSVCSHQCSCARSIWASCRNPRKLLPLCNLKWSWSALRIENRTELVLMSIKRTHYWDKCTSTDYTSPSVSFPDKERKAQLPKSWLQLSSQERDQTTKGSSHTAASCRLLCPSCLLWSVSVPKYRWNRYVQLLGKMQLVSWLLCIIQYTFGECMAADSCLRRSLHGSSTVLSSVTATDSSCLASTDLALWWGGDRQKFDFPKSVDKQWVTLRKISPVYCLG